MTEFGVSHMLVTFVQSCSVSSEPVQFTPGRMSGRDPKPKTN